MSTRVLLTVTGGIAAYKSPKIVSLLREKGHEVRVLATQNALRFVSPLTLAALSGSPVHHDLWEGGGDYEMNHIRLPEWADLFLVAPASANVLAKAATGVADDMVSTTIVACGTGEHQACPIVYAPAMNSRMLSHAATKANLARLVEWGATVIEPEKGRLACQDKGEGRMSEPETLVEKLESLGLLS